MTDDALYDWEWCLPDFKKKEFYNSLYFYVFYLVVLILIILFYLKAGVSHVVSSKYIQDLTSSCSVIFNNTYLWNRAIEVDLCIFYKKFKKFNFQENTINVDVIIDATFGNLLVIEEPEVAGVVAVRVELRVRRVLRVGEAGVAVAVLVDAGARRLQPQPWRWPWN